LGSEAFRGAVCNSGGAGFIVGVQGDYVPSPTILRKSASDSIWHGVPLTTFHFGTLFGVSAPSNKVIYACGDAGMIFKSTNGGDTWTSFNGTTSRNLNAVYFYNENRGFAVGDSGIILYTKNGGGVTSAGQEREALLKDFSLEQNYPNPFNPVTTINYQLAMNSFVTVTVFDLLGRKVATLANQERSAGNYSVQWDASTLSSGMYLYRISAGSFTQTKKMMLIR
jgi:hypothetical protein